MAFLYKLLSRLLSNPLERVVWILSTNLIYRQCDDNGCKIFLNHAVKKHKKIRHHFSVVSKILLHASNTKLFIIVILHWKQVMSCDES